ncbi:hypothetical protein [Neorickettsia findlayensis]|uniref:Uncharacterized protein n=1 Tax=Neorickettsia findlayensis TaxID=2686014 RepID=A0A6P1G9H4_9RICK|nr:hypothetical protein [Neorickettsia findlayensis]QHD64940.1 hypothetical protein GP480_00420 [Neorickettsia findlayensis]
MRHFAWCLATQPGVEKDGVLSYMNLPGKVCCAWEALQDSALDGVRDAVKERSQERSSQEGRGI